MRKRTWLALAGAVLASAMATQVRAQLGGIPGGRRGKSSGERKGGGQESQVSSLEITLHEFYEDLKLTPAQELAWQSYSTKVRALAADVARERVRARSAGQMSALQRVDRAVDVARDRLTAMEDIAQSAKALYASLTPEQQQVCDPRLANIMSMPLAASAANRS